MNLPRRPKHLPQVQALAAIGQCKLMSLWDQLFMHRRQPIAQILLTRNDITDRTQYLNAQNTFTELLNMAVIPIVNENDTLSVGEIKFGDNDTLSAFTAAMVQADYLFLMTDVDCLYDKNPRTNPDATPIQVIQDIAHLQADVSSAGSSIGTGGMSTKISAARLATSAGVTTVITRSSKPGNIAGIIAYAEAHAQPSPVKSTALASESDNNIQEPRDRTASGSSTTSLSTLPVRKQIHAGLPESEAALEAVKTPTAITTQSTAPLHTRFLPVANPIRDRHFWLLHVLPPHGSILIDKGAHRALTQRAGLLPVGVVDVQGTFARQECVRILVHRDSTDADQSTSNYHVGSPGSKDRDAARDTFEAGRALVNYSALELRRIKGLRSADIVDVLGYADGEYVAHRDNIAYF